MNHRSIPPGDHVVRYVRPTDVDDDAVNGGAFVLRPFEQHLSVNWLEVFPGSRPDQLSALRRIVRLKLARNGRFATLNVGRTKAFLKSERHLVDFIADPLDPTPEHPSDPSHAGITNLPPPEDHSAAVFVGDLLAQCVEQPLEPARVD